MSAKNVSLSEKISNILTTKPQDSDDEDETHAKLTENVEELNVPGDNEASSFRKYNAALPEELDERYAGKKSSRKQLGINDDDISHEDDANTSIENESNSNSDVEEAGSDQGSESEEGSDDEDESESGEEAEEFQHFDDSRSTDSSKYKGQCVRNQLLIWEGLLEMRIQFQKCLVAANKLPQEHTFANLTKEQSEFSNKVRETSKTITGALNKLVELQDAVARQFPETKLLYKVGSSTKRNDEDDDHEEILSDVESEPETAKKPAKKQKVDLKVELNKRHDQYTRYRNSVIQKWNDKTRLAVSKSAINNLIHSVVNQIEHNLSDKSRLIRKTQLKRSQYRIIGESEQQPKEDEQMAEEVSSRVAEEYDSNIFDDDDFYHHLLRELIEVKSADLTDPVQLGRQWIQLQNLRSKMKRRIDTRATKGRKIRYAVHSKLVNFMAPIDVSVRMNDAKNELYGSMFGKNKS